MYAQVGLTAETAEKAKKTAGLCSFV